MALTPEGRKIGGFRAIPKRAPLDGVVMMMEDHVIKAIALGLIR